MGVPDAAGCVGLLDPLCQVSGGLAGSVAQSAADLVFRALGTAFVAAAQAISATALAGLDASTRVDLTGAWVTRNLDVMAAVTLPVVVALFVVQVMGAVLRREPGGLARAVTGVARAVLGSAVAVAVTQLALLAADEVSAFIAASAGTSVRGAAARFLQLTWLAGPQAGPVLQVLLGTAVVVGSLLLWAVLLFRKAAVVLVAVFAPVAFAGAAWDQTRVWTRRWIETMAALVFCKVVIVVVFVVGVSAFGADGTTSPSPGTGAQPAATALSDLLVGLILLSIAVLAPWLTWRFVHWSGLEAATVVGGAVAASPLPHAVRATASQARYLAQSAVSSALLGAAGPAARGAAAGPAGPAGNAPPPRVPAAPPMVRPGPRDGDR